jgi:hypothetical protein
MANTASIREQLYELSAKAKELAESPDLPNMSTSDAWFISTVNTTMLSINLKKEES